MDFDLHLETPDDWYHLIDDVRKFPDIRTFVLTGARGCGKTQSTHDVAKQLHVGFDLITQKKAFANGRKVLYIRNTIKGLSTARTYFSFLCDTDNKVITLGKMGAGSIVLEDLSEKTEVLIGYTLWIGEYENFKSSKRKVDFLIYEEFSSFSANDAINRVFALTEIIATVKQTNPDFYFIAIANNIYKDDLFDNLMNPKRFVHVNIFKETQLSDDIDNPTIRAYLGGQYLVPDIDINLRGYKCLGFVRVAGTKIFMFHSPTELPNCVLSTKGDRGEMKVDMQTINMMKVARYRSLSDRNKLEFSVGLLLLANRKLMV